MLWGCVIIIIIIMILFLKRFSMLNMLNSFIALFLDIDSTNFAVELHFFYVSLVIFCMEKIRSSFHCDAQTDMTFCFD